MEFENSISTISLIEWSEKISIKLNLLMTLVKRGLHPDDQHFWANNNSLSFWQKFRSNFSFQKRRWSELGVFYIFMTLYAMNFQQLNFVRFIVEFVKAYSYKSSGLPSLLGVFQGFIDILWLQFYHLHYEIGIPFSNLFRTPSWHFCFTDSLHFIVVFSLALSPSPFILFVLFLFPFSIFFPLLVYPPCFSQFHLW